MPTYHKPQLTDDATPWLEIWDRMFDGVQPHCRKILAMLGFYRERDLEVPSDNVKLSQEEHDAIGPIVTALTIAAFESQEMKVGVLVATLRRIAKKPGDFSLASTPPVVQWQMANDHQRGDEPAGTFAMDIWGTEQTVAPYIFGEPNIESLSRAAEAAERRMQAGRSPGRSENPAISILADRLGEIFRFGGQPIVRHRKKEVRNRQLVYVEYGPFFEFLRVVLIPLTEFLRERSLAPVTIETIVREAIERT